MKGVLFNVVEDVVESTLSADEWDRVLLDAGVEGAYTSLGDYDGSELAAIVDALAARTGLPADETMRFAGEHGYRFLSRRHAELVAGYPSFGALLHNLDSVIHPEVLKLYPHARPPEFDVVDDPQDPARRIVTYRSRRHLCRLAEGLMRGAAAGFGRRVDVEHRSCVHAGDDECVMVVTELLAGAAP